MTAPTEAEIRALFAEYNVERDLFSELEEEVGKAVDAATDMIYVPDEQTIGVPFIWDNLRPTERERLDYLIESVFNEINHGAVPKLVSLIVEQTIQAALTFAAEYPDAPRVREAVTA